MLLLLVAFNEKFYAALFSALRQTHCALVACHSKVGSVA